MKSAANIDPKESGRVWSLAFGLRDPRDYERGWLGSSPIVPEHLLAFSRNHPMQGPLKLQHHRFVLIVALDGAGELCVDERIFNLRENRIFLIFPFQRHHFASFSKPQFRWVFVTFEVKQPQLLEPLRNHLHTLTPKLLSTLGDLLEDIASPGPFPAPERVTQAQIRLALMLGQLLLDHAASAAAPSIPPDSGQVTQLLEQVNRFLYCHIGQPFTLKELARAIGYSESHLRSLFRNSLRMSLGRYISEIRLRKATGLLHQGSLTVSQIAEACGYNSLFSFSRAFQQGFGCSPSEFRKKSEAALREPRKGKPKAED